jgi:hypothetical protein
MKIKLKSTYLFIVLQFLIGFVDSKNLNLDITTDGPIKVEVVKNELGYQLYRQGKPYYVKGAGGNTHLDVLVNCGGNSIRTWGLENAKQILDEAQKKGLTVVSIMITFQR